MQAQLRVGAMLRAHARRAAPHARRTLRARARGRGEPPQARRHPARGHGRPLGGRDLPPAGAARGARARRLALLGDPRAARRRARAWWRPRSRTRSCSSSRIELDRYPEVRAALETRRAGARRGRRVASAVRRACATCGARRHRGAGAQRDRAAVRGRARRSAACSCCAARASSRRSAARTWTFAQAVISAAVAVDAARAGGRDDDGRQRAPGAARARPTRSRSCSTAARSPSGSRARWSARCATTPRWRCC